MEHAQAAINLIANKVSTTLQAGEAYKQVGSDVIAPAGDITILAKTVDIVEARETSRYETEDKFKQSALTVSVSSPLLSAMETGQQMSDAASNTSDGRMQALAGAATAFKGYNTYKGMTDAAGNFDKDKATDITINLSYGSSESESKSSRQSNSAAGSTAAAGNNLTIVATGAGQASNLTAQGANLTAGNNVTLLADNNVNMLASQSNASQESSNSSSSSSVGVSYGIVSQSFGFSASASSSQGNSNGSETRYTNTQVTAGNTASIISGGDTNLIGAVVAANTVKANVGGNLNIQSLQDTSTYTSEQSSIGASISFGKGSVTGGGISASNSNIDSSYASVVQQSGIKAGDGGFQVNVAGNTDLKGSVIASTQAAVEQGKNSFNTGGTLTISDIQNNAEYKGSGYSVSLSMGSGLDAKKDTIYSPGGGAGIGSAEGNASSTSSSGISGIAGNTAVRTGDAETGIQKIFDAERVRKEIDAQMAITAAFGQQATKAVGDYAQTKLNEAAALRDQANNEPNEERKNALKAQATELEDNWGNSGILRLALHTVIGGLTGGSGGAAGAAAGTLTAPLVAQALADAGISGPLAQTLTAIASTAVGAAAGGTAGGAAAGNEVVNNYLNHAEATKREMLNDKKRRGETLSAAEKTELENLEILDVARDLMVRDACKTQGDACDLARRGLNAALATYLLPTSMNDPRLTLQGNKAVRAAMNQTLALGSDPNLATQTLLDSFKEFAFPQIGGYLAAGAIGAYLNEARIIIQAMRAESASTAAIAEAKALVAKIAAGDDLPPGFARGSGGSGPVIGTIDPVTGRVVLSDSGLSAPPVATQNSGGPLAIGIGAGSVNVGTQIGAGANKTVYLVSGDPTKVVAIANSGSVAELLSEAQQLNQLSSAGLPVVKNYGVVTVNGQPGLIMDNISGGMTLKPTFNDSVLEVKAFSSLNSNSIPDLQKIQTYLQKNTIGDFQVMVTPQGRVLLNDPSGLIAKPTSNIQTLQLIQDMLDTAKGRK